MPFCNACLDMYVIQAIELRVLLLLFFFLTLGRYDPEGILKLQIIQNGYDQSAGAVKGR